MRLLHRHGFTLVELMVALVIGSIVTAGIYSAYTGQQRINQAQDQIVEMQQNLRAGLDMMARELKMAGFDPDGTENVGFTKTEETEVTFSMRADGDGRDNNSNDQIDEEEEKDLTVQISYSLCDGYQDGDRDGDGVATCGNGVDICDLCWQTGTLSRVLVENVENVEFLYTLANGETQLNPTFDNLSNIRSVKISVLVRASGPVINAQEYVQSYTTGSGDIWGPYNTAPPYFRRRMQIINVDCRNM